MEEKWKTVAGTNGKYVVSSFGNVAIADGPALSVSIRRGYPSVSLRVDGVQRRVFVHRLVAEAFLGTCPDGRQVNHIDFDKTNNRADNLEYLTPLENMRHAIAGGRLNPQAGESHWTRRRPDLVPTGDRCGARTHPERRPRGESHGRSKLTSSEVKAIRRMDARGMRQMDIAEKFGIQQSTVSVIVARKKWAHVP